MELFRVGDRAVEADLPDLVDWMLATGCRMGEALALRYGTTGDGKPMLDLDARTWEVNGTVVRVPGAGLTRPRPVCVEVDRTIGSENEPTSPRKGVRRGLAQVAHVGQPRGFLD